MICDASGNSNPCIGVIDSYWPIPYGPRNISYESRIGEEIADIYPGKPFPVMGYVTKTGGYQEIFCPFCGCRHHHGGDREECAGEYGPVIGCRVPHCDFHPVAKRGYDIVETSPEPMPKVLADLARDNERRRNRAHITGKEYTPRWLAGWIGGWAPGTAPGPDWEPHPYDWLPDIDPKWKRGKK